jgi:hypothetical protein
MGQGGFAIAFLGYVDRARFESVKPNSPSMRIMMTACTPHVCRLRRHRRRYQY